MTVRLATLGEMALLEAVMKESMRELGRRFYDEVQTASAVRFIAVPDPEIISDGTYFAVEDEGRIVGCGGWSRRRKLFTGTSEQEGFGGQWLDPETEAARIRAMFVSPGSARRGVGKQIYWACEDAARRGGFRALELMATLPGVPFYRAVGFQEIEGADLILPDGVSLPGLRMSKALD